MTRAFRFAIDGTRIGRCIADWIGSPAFFRAMALSMILTVHVGLNLIPFWFAYVLVHSDAYQTARLYTWFHGHWPYSSTGWSRIFLCGGILALPGLLPPGGRTLGLRNVWWRMIGTGLLAGVLLWLAYILAKVTPTVAVGPGVLVSCAMMGAVSMVASAGYSIGALAVALRKLP